MAMVTPTSWVAIDRCSVVAEPPAGRAAAASSDSNDAPTTAATRATIGSLATHPSAPAIATATPEMTTGRSFRNVRRRRRAACTPHPLPMRRPPARLLGALREALTND